LVMAFSSRVHFAILPRKNGLSTQFEDCPFPVGYAGILALEPDLPESIQTSDWKFAGHGFKVIEEHFDFY
jgi:hypothetical protein